MIWKNVEQQLGTAYGSQKVDFFLDVSPEEFPLLVFFVCEEFADPKITAPNGHTFLITFIRKKDFCRGGLLVEHDVLGSLAVELARRPASGVSRRSFLVSENGGYS